MGAYEFRYVGRAGGYSSAVTRARQMAWERGIRLFGEPVVTSRRRPIPFFGPRTEFRVRFDQATRTSRGEVIDPAGSKWV